MNKDCNHIVTVGGHCRLCGDFIMQTTQKITKGK